MVDFVDAQCEAVDTPFGGQFALQSAYLFNQVVEPLQECGVRGLLGLDAGDGFAWKLAAFIVVVKNREITALDLDDQPPLVGKLKLVSMILRSAVDKIADVDWTCLHPRAEAVCTAQTNSGMDFRSICAFGPQAAHAGSRWSLN